MSVEPHHIKVFAGCLLLCSQHWGVQASDSALTFWPPQGVYPNFVSVVLATKKGRAHYTLDGTEPGHDSPGYVEPIFVTADTIVKAVTFKDGQQLGPTVTRSYSIVTNSEALLTSKLPIVIVNSLGRTIQHRNRVPAWITVLEPVDDGQTSLLSPVNYSGRAEIAIRGNSSRDLPKKSYRLELQDEQGEDLKRPLLSLPRESDWILLAGYTDRTLIRDVLAYSLWRQMGYYAPRFRFVELFVVETNRPSALFEPADYRGVYVLLEKLKRGKDRLPIQKLRPEYVSEPDITGGYIFKKDRPDPGEFGFKTPLGIRFLFDEPKDREIPDGQRSWLTNYVNRLEGALLGDGFRDPVTGYKAYLDTASFVDYHWMVELSRNPDGYAVSVHFHKDRGGLLKIGPIWDWDLSFGNILVQRLLFQEGWEFERGRHPPLYKWYERLFEDPDFLQAYIDRWSELRQSVFSKTNLFATIDALAAQVKESEGRNYRRWPTLLGIGQPDGTDLYALQIHALKDWLTTRLAWIESQCIPPALPKFGLGPEGSIVELHAEVGTIYYTLDGTDPRLPGGDPRPAARAFSGPIALARATEIRARVRSPFGIWSAPLVIPGSLATGESN